jgi:hypothetical protein
MEKSTQLESYHQFLNGLNILFTDNLKSIELLQDVGCIPQEMSCDKCGIGFMKLKKDSSKRNGVF